MARRTCTSSSSASLLILLLSAGTALACADDEATLFSCLAKDGAHTIELCAVRDDAAGGFQSLQYRYGTAEKTELVFPANRDEGMFPNGDDFDIARENANKHLGFSRGPHFCVGQPLAVGTVARIFTGAPVPEGADAIVMLLESASEENYHDTAELKSRTTIQPQVPREPCLPGSTCSPTSLR